MFEVCLFQLYRGLGKQVADPMLLPCTAYETVDSV